MELKVPQAAGIPLRFLQFDHKQQPHCADLHLAADTLDMAIASMNMNFSKLLCLRYEGRFVGASARISGLRVDIQRRAIRLYVVTGGRYSGCEYDQYSLDGFPVDLNIYWFAYLIQRSRIFLCRRHDHVDLQGYIHSYEGGSAEYMSTSKAKVDQEIAPRIPIVRDCIKGWSRAGSARSEITFLLGSDIASARKMLSNLSGWLQVGVFIGIYCDKYNSVKDLFELLNLLTRDGYLEHWQVDGISYYRLASREEGTPYLPCISGQAYDLLVRILGESAELLARTPFGELSLLRPDYTEPQPPEMVASWLRELVQAGILDSRQGVTYVHERTYVVRAYDGHPVGESMGFASEREIPQSLIKILRQLPLAQRFVEKVDRYRQLQNL